MRIGNAGGWQRKPTRCNTCSCERGGSRRSSLQFVRMFYEESCRLSGRHVKALCPVQSESSGEMSKQRVPPYPSRSRADDPHSPNSCLCALVLALGSAEPHMVGCQASGLTGQLLARVAAAERLGESGGGQRCISTSWRRRRVRTGGHTATIQATFLFLVGAPDTKVSDRRPAHIVAAG